METASTTASKPLFYFFYFGFYGPFKNISLISSRSFIKGGRKPENPGKNHLTIRKQTLAFPHVTRTRASKHGYLILTNFSRTSLGPWKFVRDMGCSSHWELIIAPVQEANGDNLGETFSIFYTIMACWVYSLELPRWGDSNEYTQILFHDEIRNFP